jgi:hypothetical protein
MEGHSFQLLIYFFQVCLGWHAKDVTGWARNCLDYQLTKVIQHITIPSRRFSNVCVDLVGHMPESQSFTHLFNINRPTTVDGLNLVFGMDSRFSVPVVLTSDRRMQFTSSIWAELNQLLSTCHAATIANHLETNGMVERFHRHLKDALHAHCATDEWAAHRPWVTPGLRPCAPHQAKRRAVLQHTHSSRFRPHFAWPVSFNFRAEF